MPLYEDTHHPLSISRREILIKVTMNKLVLFGLLVVSMMAVTVLGQPEVLADTLLDVPADPQLLEPLGGLGPLVRGSQRECRFRPRPDSWCRRYDRVEAWTWRRGRCRRIRGCYTFGSRNVFHRRRTCNRVCKYSK